MNRQRHCLYLLSQLLLLLIAVTAVRAQENPLSDCSFVSTGENEFFPLRPGIILTLEANVEDDEGDLELIQFIREVTDETREIALEIDGESVTVETRILEETNRVDGEIEEFSRSFYAHCEETGTVYVFGEEVDIYEDEEIIDHEGTWLAGVDGAQPGIIMPGEFVVGEKYRHENAPDVAVSEAENAEENVDVQVPAGSFTGGVRTVETDLLEPDEDPSEKIYAPGLGLIVDDSLELVSFSLGTSGSLADCTLVAEGENPYFPLRPGLTLYLEGEEEDDEGVIEQIRLVRQVLSGTKSITWEIEGESREDELAVIKDTKTVDGEVVEVSLSYYAHCEETDTVYLFGRDVDHLEDRRGRR